MREPWEIWEEFQRCNNFLTQLQRATTNNSSRFKRTIDEGSWKCVASGNGAKKIIDNITSV